MDGFCLCRSVDRCTVEFNIVQVVGRLSLYLLDLVPTISVCLAFLNVFSCINMYDNCSISFFLLVLIGCDINGYKCRIYHTVGTRLW